MKLAEPDVSLSDFALTIESLALTYLTATLPVNDPASRTMFLVFFPALGLATLLAGFAHGIFHDHGSRMHEVVWRASLLSLGLAALALWGVCIVAVTSGWSSIVLAVGVIALYLFYVFKILFVRHDYRIAIRHYAPALVALALTCLWRWIQHPSWWLLAGVAGTAWSVLAGVLQQRKVALHPRYFTHNALYHLNQGIALFAIYLGSRALISGGPG
ncbi:MAG: hypothetical protein P8X48_05530 [Acidiferrobacteraceae bacterium]|jgi:hypothetical protein